MIFITPLFPTLYSNSICVYTVLVFVWTRIGTASLTARWTASDHFRTLRSLPHNYTFSSLAASFAQPHY